MYLYIAPNEEMVREHAKHGGFPANAVSRVFSTMEPTTAEEVMAYHLQKDLFHNKPFY